MKKYLIIFGVALLVFAACKKENNTLTPSPKEQVVLTFTSEKPGLIDADTKTAWNPGTSSIVWTAGDQIRIGYKLNDNWMGKTEAGSPKFYLSGEVAIDSQDPGLGTFEVPVDNNSFSDPGTTGSYVFYGISPKVSGTDIVSTASVATLTLPTTQVPEENSFDKSADFMIGKSAAMDLSGLPSDPIEISWNRIVAQADITFSNLDFDGAETVSLIKLTFNNEALVAGDFTVNVETGDLTSGTESEITLEGTNLVASASSVEAWCCLLPVTFTGLDVEIKTDKATYTRSITGKNLKFKQNARNTLTVNMSTANRVEIPPVEYSKYSGAITEGDYIIFYDGNAMKAEISSDRFTSVTTNPVNDVIATNDENIVWHIAASGEYFTIYNATTKLYAASTGAKNKAQLLSDGTDDKSLWTISGSDTYEFVNKQNTSNSVNANLRYNVGYGWACYATTTGGALSLYKIDNRTPLDAPASVTATLNASTTNAIDVTFSSVTNAVTYVITATPVAGGDAVVKSDVASSPATIDGLLYETAYIVSVYAVPASTDADHKKSPATAAANSVTTGAAPAAPEGYELITSYTSDVTSGLYIIAAKVDNKYYAMSNTFASKIDGTEVSLTNGVIVPSDATDYSVSFSVSSSQYTIKGNNNAVLAYSSSTNFNPSGTEGINKAKWTISEGENGTFRISNVDSNTRVIAFNGSQFGPYASSNVTSGSASYYDVELFKYNGTVTVKSNPVTTVTPASPIDLEVGDTQQLTVDTDSDGAISYESDDENVATVTSAGLIEAIAVGTATITVTTAATDSYYQGTTTITVTVTDGTATIADALSAPGTYSINDVAVYGVKGNALILGDSTGKIYAYKSSHGLSVGDVRTVSGSTIWYNSGDVYEFDSPTFSGSGTTTINHGTAVEFADNAATLQTETGFVSTGSGAAHTAVYVHAIGDQSGRNITTSNGKILYLSAAESATDGKTVEVYGYVYAYSESHTNFNFLVTSIEEYVDPNAKSITALKSSITGISADGVTNATETGVYSLTNAADSDVTVTPDGTVVTAASISGGTLTYTVAANTGSARNGSVTLAVTGGNSITITISQLAGNGSTTINETITSGTFSGDTNSISLTTSSGITITQLKSDGTNCNTTYNSVSTLRVYRANEMQFTGKTFTKIEMYYTGTYSGADWSVVAGGGTVTIDSTNKKVVWTNSSGASTVTLKNSTSSGTNTQLRTTKFYFEY